VYTQRLLLIILALTCGGLVAAPPRNAGLQSTATAHIKLTIPPRVELARVHNLDLEAASGTSAIVHSDALCLSSLGNTEYSVTAQGRTDIGLYLLDDATENCASSSDTAYALNVPLDSAESVDFGNQLTLIVSAE
jgi:hypothetical protein